MPWLGCGRAPGLLFGLISGVPVDGIHRRARPGQPLTEPPGPDATGDMTWIPFVTFWQVTMDMLEPVDVALTVIP